MLVPKEVLVDLAALARTAVLDHPDLPVMLDLPAQTVNPDLLATVVRMRPEAAKATLVVLVAVENLDLQAVPAIVVLQAIPARLATLDPLEVLEAPEMLARKDHLAHLVQLAAMAQMPNIAHALIVPKRLKRSTANSLW